MDIQADKITKQHVLDAVKRVEQDDIPLRPSTGYDVIINGKAYPPKDIMRLAHELATGIYGWKAGGGEATNKYLIKLGFEVKPKSQNELPDSNRVTVWKLGCNWGTGKPSFYNLIKDNEILIGEVAFPYQVGDLVLVTEGFQVFAIARVLTQPVPVTKAPEFEQDFKKLEIEYIETVTWCEAEYYVLPTELRFEYKLQKGIRQVQQPSIRNKAIELWTNRFSQQQNNNDFLKGKMEKKPLNTILYGPPGTGKTFSTINKALEIIDPQKYEEIKGDRGKLTALFRELQFDPDTEKGQIAFVTFHQSMSYEDFIEGIKPTLESENTTGQVSYELANGIFKRIALAASSKENNFNEKIEWLKRETSELDNRKPIEINTGNTKFSVSYNGGKTFRIKPLQSARPENDYPASIENIRKVYVGADRKEVYNPTYVLGILKYLYDQGLDRPENGKGKNSKPYVVIIDEINRGNVSQIFGELITLIEEDKRMGEPEALEVILPYSKRKFSVPKNLYIIGTMNTADRSVEALDTALRRRFSFIELRPEYDELGKCLDIDLKLMLETINERIEVLLDRDHQIGHAYLLGVKKAAKPFEKLKEVFQKNIVPLLQEYFYGDYAKIGAVLGHDFVPANEMNTSFASGEWGIDPSDFRPTYQLVNVMNFTSTQPFINIYEGK